MNILKKLNYKMLHIPLLYLIFSLCLLINTSSAITSSLKTSYYNSNRKNCIYQNIESKNTEGKTNVNENLKPILLTVSSSATSSSKPIELTKQRLFLIYLRKLPEGIRNGIASGLSTIIAKSLLQPFDTIKTLQQSSSASLSPLKAITNIIKTRGILGLWSGIGITIIGSTPSTSVYFGLYSTTKASLIRHVFKSPDKMNLLIVALSASIANTFASFIRAPFEVCSICLYVQYVYV